ncbi:MAG: hypothetical protein K1X57_00685 [Gemmataceae bacterium]|nr:hypothetical protein [Gemmataceae bacterium]
MHAHDDLVQLALDELYGLLDGPAAKAAREKLATPEGHAARREAQRLGDLMASAARVPFPEAKFAAPSVLRSAHRAGAAGWIGWVVAASALFAIAIPTLAGFVGDRTRAQQAILARAEATAARAEFNRSAESWRKQVQVALNEHRAAETELRKLQAESAVQLENKLAEARARQFNVVVSGPAAITPGAPNQYQIATQDMTGKAVAAKLSARVVDQLGKVVFEPAPVATGGMYTLKLPVDLPLTPDRELSLEVTATGPAGPAAVVKQDLPLAAPVYLAHLTTDKPMYQPGETVRVRALVLERGKLQPPTEDLTLTVTVLDPQGAELSNIAGRSRLGDDDKLRGLAATEFTLSESTPGGEYTVRLRESSGRAPEQTRKFLVNKYQPATIEKKLEFARKSYGPGDEVVAVCQAARVSGPLANQPVSASAQVDGKDLPVEHAKATDAKGGVVVKFRLPAEIEKGSASVRVTFTDGGAVESLVKPVPVVLRKLSVEFFPEGGDLVAGVPNRVYMQARTTLGKPADLEGRIVDAAGKVVANVATLNDPAEPGINQGQARFEFTPAAGEKYRLTIDKPEGIVGEYPLPAAKPAGVVLNTGLGVAKDNEPLPLTLHAAGTERKLVVGADARGRLLDHQRLTAAPGAPIKVTLNPAPGYGGSTRVTVFEETGEGRTRQLTPVAERLVYRTPAKKVELTVAPDKTAYAPGDKAGLKVTAKDESGKAVPAITMLGVVNQSVVVMADEKTYRSMPTHFLLTGEVEKADDLEHVDVVLGNHPKASAALDLLLGVQGWRRFVESGELPPAEKAKTAAAPAVRVDTIQYVRAKAEEVNRPAFEEYRKKLEAAEKKLSAAIELPDSLRKQQSVAAQAEQSAAEKAAEAGFAVVNRKVYWQRVLPWATILAAAAGIVLAGWSLLRNHGRYLGAMACLVCAAASGVAWLNVHRQEHIPTPVTDTNSPAEIQLIENKSEQEKLFLGDVERLDQKLQAATPADRAERILTLAAPKKGERGIAYDYAGANYKAIRPGKPGDGGGDADGEVAARGMLPTPSAGGAGGTGGPGGVVPPPAPMAPPGGGGRAPGVARGGVDPRSAGQPDAAARKPAGQPAEAKKDEPAGFRGNTKRPAMMPAVVEPPPSPIVGAARRIEEVTRDQLRQRDRAEAGRPIAGLVGGGGGRGGFGRAKELNEVVADLPAIQRFVVREYAHVHKPAADGVRTDFTETVFWHPAIIVPAEGATASFDLSDSVTRYQVIAAAHTLDGRLGSFQSLVTARKPLAVEPKIPVEITAGDRIDMPVTVSNETDRPRDVKLSLETPGLVPVGPQPVVEWSQPAGSRSRRLFGLRPLDTEATARVRIKVAGEDAMERTIPVVPEGFPIMGQISQELRGSARHTVPLPATWVPGSLKCEVALFPTPLADLQRGLDGLLREPGGCFEQTSTTNYPNALIMNYLRETNQANPELVAKARGMLDRGYARLTSFEVPANQIRQGYEWFGHAPAHEALTAYGLLQFRDMAKVVDVDPAMLERTKTYLMSRRDGKGGFQRSPAALDSFGRASEKVTNAYIVWALTESGKNDDVTAELDRLEAESRTENDPYFLALVANALWNRQRNEPARAIFARLATMQLDDGSLKGTSKSITGSQGDPLTIETTALSLLGWLKGNQQGEYAGAIRKGVKWIGSQRRGTGSFGPTQSTILALKALVEYAKAYKQPPEAGTVSVRLGEQVVASIDFTADRQDAIVLEVPDPAKWMKPGDNTLTVETSGKNLYPYTVAWSYHTLQPPSASGCAVSLTTSLAKTDLTEGESTQLRVNVSNVSKQGQGMTVAIIGLPAGLSLPDDFKQLRDLSRLVDGKPGPIAFWELRGRELVLYWRDFAPDAKVDLNIDVIARVPGRYRGPASRAYLYYDPEAKCWTAPLAASIKAE